MLLMIPALHTALVTDYNAMTVHRANLILCDVDMPKVLSTSTFALLVQTQAESRCHPLVLDLSHCG